jgi:hypothetical protein
MQAIDLITGIPTSTPQTGARQRSRLQEFGLTVAALPILRDIDTASDIDAVLENMSYARRSRRFAQVVRQFGDKAAA